MDQDTTGKRWPFGIPALIGIIVIVLFLPYVIMTGSQERKMRHALEDYQPFAQPAFPVTFSKTIKWDPLGFMGNGIEAGFWKWTPAGMELEAKGRSFFSDTNDKITSIVGAGRREVSSLNGYVDHADLRELKFRYRWTNVTPPAEVLLSRPPKVNEDYDGRAVLAHADDGWKVQSLETPDFDIPMKLLVDTTAGLQH